MALKEKIIKGVADAAMKAKVAGNTIKGAAKAGAETIKKGAKATSEAYNDAMKEASRKAAKNSGEGIVNEAIRNAGEEGVKKYTARSLRGKDLSEMTVDQLRGHAKDLGMTGYSKLRKDDLVKQLRERVGSINDSVDDIVEEGVKAAKSGGSGGKSTRKRNAIIGSVVGGISGAGIGGLAGMATGADEDNQNGMVVTGALAGIAGGAMVGGLFGKNITKIAGGIAKGASNEAVEGGAKGLMNKAGASIQNFVDKGAVASLDDIGSNIAKKASKSGRLEVAKEVHRRTGGTAKEALDFVNDLASNPETLRNMDQSDALVKTMKKANAIGGAAQGAIMGSVGGAVIGGIGGAADEDDTFIDGALKGGMLGGVLGGIGGGASGFFNNNARILSNTTSNIKSLIGK